MKQRSKVYDGLEALRNELSFADIMKLIERTAKWVSPETFRFLPLWYPEFARQSKLYNANWSQPRLLKKSTHKQEGNTSANKALTQALGFRGKERPNWSCCHIWGLDDSKFQSSNLIVKDRRYYSCVANMVLLPTPLKAFTDAMPEVKNILRVGVFNLYGWTCEHEALQETADAVKTWDQWEAFPKSWPRPDGKKMLPMGTTQISKRITDAADSRKAVIKNDLANAGPEFPREEVKEALEFWKVKL